MDIGGPGGTGSSGPTYMQKPRTEEKKEPAIISNANPISYMDAGDMNNSLATRQRKQKQLEQAVPVGEKSKACGNCTIF